MTRYLAVSICCIVLSGCGYRRDDGGEKLKLALKLKTLPASVRNISFGEDSWTDYIVHVYCEVDPLDFPALLTGRPFERRLSDPFSGEALKPYDIEPPDYAKSIPVFTAEEFYTWKGEGLTSCDLVTTKAHDKVYVIYGTD